jgi:hypothetical protein
MFARTTDLVQRLQVAPKQLQKRGYFLQVEAPRKKMARFPAAWAQTRPHEPVNNLRIPCIRSPMCRSLFVARQWTQKRNAMIMTTLRDGWIRS